MNLFLVERRDELIAQALNDKRLHNQAKECCQLMVTACIVRGIGSVTKANGELAKGWTPNHPMCKWVAGSGQAYRLTYDVAVQCLIEHYYRFGTVSTLTHQLRQLKQYRNSIPDLDNFTYCLCLPDEYIQAVGSKYTDDLEVAVKCYRHYCYYNKRMQLDQYTKRDLPPWLVSASKIRYPWCSEPVPF